MSPAVGGPKGPPTSHCSSPQDVTSMHPPVPNTTGGAAVGPPLGCHGAFVSPLLAAGGVDAAIGAGTAPTEAIAFGPPQAHRGSVDSSSLACCIKATGGPPVGQHDLVVAATSSASGQRQHPAAREGGSPEDSVIFAGTVDAADQKEERRPTEATASPFASQQEPPACGCDAPSELLTDSVVGKTDQKQQQQQQQQQKQPFPASSSSSSSNKQRSSCINKTRGNCNTNELEAVVAAAALARELETSLPAATATATKATATAADADAAAGAERSLRIELEGLIGEVGAAAAANLVAHSYRFHAPGIVYEESNNSGSKDPAVTAATATAAAALAAAEALATCGLRSLEVGDLPRIELQQQRQQQQLLQQQQQQPQEELQQQVKAESQRSPSEEQQQMPQQQQRQQQHLLRSQLQQRLEAKHRALDKQLECLRLLLLVGYLNPHWRSYTNPQAFQ